MASTRLARTGIGAAVAFATALVVAITAGTAQAAIFGLLDTSELYSSTNGGVTWTALSTLPASDAVGLAAGASSSELFIATRSGSVYRSSNGGSTWAAVGALTASDVAAFTINYDASVLVLTESGTVYRSTDGGVTFTGLAALAASNFTALVRGPLGRFYALTKTGEVYESQDQGVTWIAVGRVTVTNAVSIRRRIAELYLLTKTGEVYRSIDYGRAWLPVGAITASNMAAILNAGSTLVAAAETGEIYASASGASWTAVGTINQSGLVSLGEDTPLATGVPIEDQAPSFVARVPSPNPTARRFGSTFVFVTSGPDRVRLQLYDARGRRLAELHSEPFASAGVHSVPWRPSGLPSGTYLVRITTQSGRTSALKWTLLE